MFEWLPIMLSAYLFVGFSACYLYLLPIGFAQFAMVFACLFFSIILADVALLRRRLSRIRRELAREEAILGQVPR